MVIVAFARVDNLIKIAKHLEHSDSVKEIIVAWNNQEVSSLDAHCQDESADLSFQIGCPAELTALPWVRCIPQAENLVHNR